MNCSFFSYLGLAAGQESSVVEGSPRPLFASTSTWMPEPDRDGCPGATSAEDVVEVVPRGFLGSPWGPEVGAVSRDHYESP